MTASKTRRRGVKRWAGLGLGALLAGGLVGAEASAAVGPGMMVLSTLSPGGAGDGSFQAGVFGLQSETQGTGDDVGVTVFELVGWSRVSENGGGSVGRAAQGGGPVSDGFDPSNWTVGVLTKQVWSSGGEADGVPQRIVDQQVSVGARLGVLDLGEWGRWDWGATAGFGYAGDTPYAGGEAWYGTGSLWGATQLDPESTLFVFLEYNGNRTIFPDVPLPGFLYRRQVRDDLAVSLGFPFVSATWTPNDRFTLRGTIAVSLATDLDLSYRLDGGWSAFARYYTDSIAGDIDGGTDNRRIFFEQQRIEVGMRRSLNFSRPGPATRPAAGDPRGNAWQIEAAVGWAFDLAYDTGFDSRDLAGVADLDDAFYLRLGLSHRF
ncbi:MAG: hypothetical protein AAGI68_13590 [Planctomycetota bacterium]